MFARESIVAIRMERNTLGSGYTFKEYKNTFIVARCMSNLASYLARGTSQVVAQRTRHVQPLRYGPRVIEPSSRPEKAPSSLESEPN